MQMPWQIFIYFYHSQFIRRLVHKSCPGLTSIRWRPPVYQARPCIARSTVSADSDPRPQFMEAPYRLRCALLYFMQSNTYTMFVCGKGEKSRLFSGLDSETLAQRNSEFTLKRRDYPTSVRFIKIAKDHQCDRGKGSGRLASCGSF